MKANTTAQPLVFFDQPIIYIDDFDAVVREVNKLPEVKSFIVIAESGVKIPAAVTKLGKERNIQVVRIRSSGSWNSLYRLMVEHENTRKGFMSAEDNDLVFLSFHSAHDISAGLKRHRTFNRLTCRELYFLNTIRDLDVPIHAIEGALSAMPNVATGVYYNNLSIEQCFTLSAFEFGRYIRPVHCPESLDMLLKALPFYEQSPTQADAAKAA